jgi:fructose-1,6-bisphosphatase/sedoheptulose 1,7-bisphosphatase-like protein
MGFLQDQIAKMVKKKKQEKAVVMVKTARKDISYLPASATAVELTQFINNRINVLLGLGAAGEIVIENANIQYIDKTTKEDYTLTTEYIGEEQAYNEEPSSGYGNVEKKRWITTKTIENSTLNINKDAVTFYLVLIEYVQLTRS